jgi:pimeloyl-ACP methyl ester carboxylesterase
MASTVDLAGNPTWWDDQGQPDGPPLVLLHGGLSDSGQWALTTPAFTDTHRVLLFDRRGHGHTPDVEGPITYDLMAQDTVAFLEEVVGGPADLVGHSDGANVALLVGLARPDLVRRLVLISGNFHHDGLIPGAIVPEELAPVVQPEYAAASPDGGDHFPTVLAKVARMWAEEPTLTEADLAAVTARTLVLVGDDDAIFAEHTLALYRAIADSELAVIPGTSHLMILEKPDLVNGLILDFLTKDPAPTFMPVRRSH